MKKVNWMEAKGLVLMELARGVNHRDVRVPGMALDTVRRTIRILRKEGLI